MDDHLVHMKYQHFWDIAFRLNKDVSEEHDLELLISQYIKDQSYVGGEKHMENSILEVEMLLNQHKKESEILKILRDLGLNLGLNEYNNASSKISSVWLKNLSKRLKSALV